MCAPKVKIPKPQAIGAAPAAPLPTAEALKMQDRDVSKDGAYTPQTSRSRRTLRTDIRVPTAGAGINVARMTA